MSTEIGVVGQRGRTAGGRDDPRDLVVGATGAWPGRVDSPPMSSTSAPRRPCARLRDGRRDRDRPAPAREQPVAGERVGRHVEDAHHERAAAPVGASRDRSSGAGRRAARRGVGGEARTRASRCAAQVGPARGRRRRLAPARDRAQRRGRSCGAYRIAQERVVDEPPARLADEIQRAGDDDGPCRPASASSSAAVGVRRRDPDGAGRAAAAARHASASASARQRPGQVDGRADDRRARERPAPPRPPRPSPSTSLSAIDAHTSVERARRARNGRGRRAPARAPRPRPGCGRRRGAPPGRRPSSSSSRPGQRAAAYPRRRASAGDRREPRRLERVQQRVGDGDVRGLVPARAGPTSTAPRPGSSTRRASRSQPRIGAGLATASGTPSRAQRRRMIASASPAAPVTARSPRFTIRTFSRAMAAIVGPSWPMWSSPTFVSTATPPSQALVASRRPPRPTSTSARSSRDRRSGGTSPRSAARTRWAGRGGGRRGRRAAGPRATSEANASGSIGRPSTTIRSRYVTRCGLGVSPTR